MSLYASAFEVMIYLLFVLCLRHAWRRGWANLWRLIAGVLFGILLEVGTIRELHTYSYGQFWIMLGAVPLCVGVAWGCIVYAARLYSGGSNLPGWAKPVLSALFALNIDLSMDAIAVRLGFWHWANDIHSQFFGVPYGNFWAWFWVIVSFTAGLRLTLAWRRSISTWLAPVAAVVGGLVVVLLTNQLIVGISDISFALYVVVVALVLAAAMLLVVGLALRRPGRVADRARAPSSPAVLVPLIFHAFFLLVGTISGIYARLPALLADSLLMAGIGVFLHREALRSLFPKTVSA